MAYGALGRSRLGENLRVIDDANGVPVRAVAPVDADGNAVDLSDLTVTVGDATVALAGGSTAGSMDGASVTGTNQVLVSGTTPTKAVYVSNDTDAEVEFYYDTELLIRLGPTENAILPVDIGTADLEVKHTGATPTTGANVSGTLIR